ncbi:hypothetical protein [Citrobacter farmeri]|uniref:hypothetical protein n=1 Tax=Citrobacter farmeri TaxID=67824 RepID=UPI001901840B|nr:hypothetical protein [Citrobacter farmeri]ELK6621937.1 hypothetical protein [Citrobacter amalonaticus]MBJ9136979.1 hypothetical protein [Citrobacter farmeri]
MPNHIHVENISEVEMHANNLAPIIRDSQASTDLAFKVLDSQITDDAINTLVKILKQELDETDWNFLVYKQGEEDVVVSITKI